MPDEAETRLDDEGEADAQGRSRQHPTVRIELVYTVVLVAHDVEVPGTSTSMPQCGAARNGTPRLEAPALRCEGADVAAVGAYDDLARVGRRRRRGVEEPSKSSNRKTMPATAP
jgi:hypothetical protein